MYIRQFRLYMASLLVVAIIIFGSSPTIVSAQTITNEQIEEQKHTVLLGLVSTLEEQVKLLQMIYITRLKERVTMLERLVNEQSS